VITNQEAAVREPSLKYNENIYFDLDNLPGRAQSTELRIATNSAPTSLVRMRLTPNKRGPISSTTAIAEISRG
jgi:hypothetical protein